MKKLGRISIRRRTGWIILSLAVLAGILMTFYTLTTPPSNTEYSMPDWMYILMLWLGVVVILALVTVAKPVNLETRGKSYVVKEGDEFYVGYYECPACRNRFTADGYCSSCPPQRAPKLEFREEVWKDDPRQVS